MPNVLTDVTGNVTSRWVYLRGEAIFAVPESVGATDAVFGGASVTLEYSPAPSSDHATAYVDDAGDHVITAPMFRRFYTPGGFFRAAVTSTTGSTSLPAVELSADEVQDRYQNAS